MIASWCSIGCQWRTQCPFCVQKILSCRHLCESELKYWDDWLVLFNLNAPGFEEGGWFDFCPLGLYTLCSFEARKQEFFRLSIDLSSSVAIAVRAFQRAQLFISLTAFCVRWSQQEARWWNFNKENFKLHSIVRWCVRFKDQVEIIMQASSVE